MREVINEPVGVLATFSAPSRGGVKVVPQIMAWRDRRYRLERMGLYYPERRGTKQVHIFSFLSDGTTFRVELDPERLVWTLVEVYYEA